MSPVSLSFTEAELGFEARARADVRLADLLSNNADGPRMSWGFPSDVLAKPTAAAFPRTTFYRTTAPIRRPGTGTVRLRVEHWVWPSGENGGLARLGALDDLFLELFDEVHWVHGDAQLYAVALASIDFPTGPGAPLRRLRPFDVFVSPAA